MKKVYQIKRVKAKTDSRKLRKSLVNVDVNASLAWDLDFRGDADV